MPAPPIRKHLSITAMATLTINLLLNLPWATMRHLRRPCRRRCNTSTLPTKERGQRDPVYRCRSRSGKAAQSGWLHHHHPLHLRPRHQTSTSTASRMGKPANESTWRDLSLRQGPTPPIRTKGRLTDGSGSPRKQRMLTSRPPVSPALGATPRMKCPSFTLRGWRIGPTSMPSWPTLCAL